MKATLSGQYNTKMQPLQVIEVKNVNCNIRNSRQSEYWALKRTAADTTYRQVEQPLLCQGAGWCWVQTSLFPKALYPGAGSSETLTPKLRAMTAMQASARHTKWSRLVSNVNHPVRRFSSRNKPGFHQKFVDTDTFLWRMLGHQPGSAPSEQSENETAFTVVGWQQEGHLGVCLNLITEAANTRKAEGLRQWKGKLISFVNTDENYLLFCLRTW